MEYNFKEIEQNAKKKWNDEGVYKVSNTSDKPKFYILDMFPYPSGAGLHVGHPLGYIASDIYARYKRMKGFNVLHPMGFDEFGLPAEQYAIETGQHPVDTTKKNIARYREQLDNIGFCYDWDRQVRTSDKKYYRWTQWIFLQLFNSYFDKKLQKAVPIPELVSVFENEGNAKHICPADEKLRFTATEWNAFTEKEQQDILMNYRLAFCGFGEVNWCEALGTVLANDEVVNGLSERGGHPVVKKKLRQWYLRITEYADRLLDGLNTVDFSEAMKEMQRNWIGKSVGAQISFQIKNTTANIPVFTTRPDTIFGVDFMVLAPEHDLVSSISTEEQKQAVEEYITYVKSRSERERMAEKKISGCFTGAYAIHPFSGKEIPVWISEYVLAGYGTGAIMAVPCGDERDHKFAQHFQIPITNIIGEKYNGEEAYAEKDFTLVNSDFINGLSPKDAAVKVIERMLADKIGEAKVNFRMRDAAFSRQRYWGEPFPIKWKDGIAYPLSEMELPLELPHVESYGPGPDGEGPLANIASWKEEGYETNTMPGYAGSSWYFLRFMDPHNEHEFADRAATDYWNQVDIYIGGTEHAVGHLLYSRMWTKALYDLGFIGFDEPFKKLVNQGMITAFSYFVDLKNYFAKSKSNNSFNVGYSYHRILSLNEIPEEFVIGNNNGEELEWSFRPEIQLGLYRLKDVGDFIESGDILYKESYHKWLDEYPERKIELSKFLEPQWLKSESNREYIKVKVETEKMSKSKFNVKNPDDIIAQYGADTFRMYEMFLGPLDVSKPWDTKGIEGVHRFLRKFWRLYNDDAKGWIVTEEAATEAELKALHKSIKKIEQDTERFSFNTAVSQFMIAVNELTDLNCHKREILKPLVQLITPYAPHIAEELWQQMGETDSIILADFPKYEERYVTENSKVYPVAINGKTRTELEFALDASQADIEKVVMENEIVQKWLEGKTPKKIIFVKGKMINMVI
ncbi:MAG: leucine--tRNA ligase [Chitinophagaceae bacterium]|nr:leucine--tRNA ligase [Chitinophagaceae bacterium]